MANKSLLFGNEKGTMGLLIMMIIAGVSIAIVIPILVTAITNINERGPIDPPLFLPTELILGIFLMGIAISLIAFKPKEDNLEEEQLKQELIMEYEPIEPEKILKRRYAKGEINSKEYTERMSRL